MHCRYCHAFDSAYVEPCFQSQVPLQNRQTNNSLSLSLSRTHMRGCMLLKLSFATKKHFGDLKYHSNHRKTRPDRSTHFVLYVTAKCRIPWTGVMKDASFFAFLFLNEIIGSVGGWVGEWVGAACAHYCKANPSLVIFTSVSQYTPLWLHSEEVACRWGEEVVGNFFPFFSIEALDSFSLGFCFISFFWIDRLWRLLLLLEDEAAALSRLHREGRRRLQSGLRVCECFGRS